MSVQGDLVETPPAGVTARRLETSAGPVAVWDRPGAGPTLLMIHGNSASKGVFAGMFEAPALSGRHLVAMDLPGCGEAANAADPQSAYTIPGMARTAAETIAALGLANPVVLGWSLGGHVAIEAAGQGVGMAGMILTGTPPCGPGPDEVAESFHESEEMEVTFMEDPSADQLSAYVRHVYGPRRPIPEAFFAAARRSDGRLRSRFAEHWLAAQEGFHQRTVVAEWANPIAVIQGELEPFFDPSRLDDLSWKNLWRGAGQMVAGGGHAPFFDQPQAYSELVAQFLDDLGA
ncbi:alpha/beta fold hydrolase [Phenylobacterium sp.]|uniref:alpha/beta fold hydrolase n=1 Tax=Phenylobacterium sp. TaxID=1871053 RepID=UPI0035AE02F3